MMSVCRPSASGYNGSVNHFMQTLFTDVDMRILIRKIVIALVQLFQLVSFLSGYGSADTYTDTETSNSGLNIFKDNQ